MSKTMIAAVLAACCAACAANPNDAQDRIWSDEIATDQPVGSGVPPDAAKPAPEPIASLAGSWRVSDIDGEPMDGPNGLALTGDADRFYWEPSCAGYIRRYSIEGGTVAFASMIPPGSPPPPICTIGVPPVVKSAFRVIDAASTIERTPENGIRLAGGGRSLTLFSQ